MKQQHQSVVLAGLLAMALGLQGCAAWRGGSDTGSEAGATGASSAGTSGSTGTGYEQSGASSTGSTGTGSSTMGSTTEGSTTGNTTGGTAGTMSDTASSTSPNSTVVSIELVPRTSSGIGGASTVAGAAMGSSTAGASASSTGERVYRITLRMDDGSTQVITQETTPDFRSGDRVSSSGGAIRR